MKLSLAGLALPIALGLLVATSPARANETILFNCFFPTQHPVCTKAVKELANRIETATEGRVKVQIPPKSVAAPPDQYEAVKNGVVDGALIFNSFLANKVPGIQFSLLPFVGHAEAEPTAIALWNTYEKYFGKLNEFDDVVLVGVHASAGAEFFSTTDKPIETVADIADRKMWALPGVTADLIKETGSPVVSGPAVQMLEIISKGVVDGYTGVPFASVDAFKLIDYTKSATVFDKKIFQPTFSYFISRKKWDAISPEDQKAIRSVLGADFSDYAGRVNDEIDEQGRTAVKKAGIEIIKGDPAVEAQLVELGKPMVDAWVAKVKEMGIDGNAVLKDYEAAYQAAKKQ